MNPIQLIKYVVIIVAGGSGTRMQAAIPKQFLLLNGNRPVLMHTIEGISINRLQSLLLY